MKTKNSLLLYEKPNELTTALEYTAGKTGFSAELIEKDYFCTAILDYLYSQPDCPLIFKGGTLLTKVHTGFYRLSENLDFSIPISSNTARRSRSNAVKSIKAAINSIESQLNNFKIDTPFTAKPFLPLVACQCLSMHEAYAEKVCAVLTINRLAIRDYFDIHYAIKNNILNYQNSTFIDLTRRKIADSAIIEFNTKTYNYLVNKIRTELTPNLRSTDTNDFDLDSIINTLKTIASNTSQQLITNE